MCSWSTPFRTAYTPLLRYTVAPILPDGRDREECLSDVLLRVWDSIGAAKYVKN